MPTGIITLAEYESILIAIHDGDLEPLVAIERNHPEKFRAMIEVKDYEVFRLAARYGHRRILEYLAEKALDKLQAMTEADNYGAFRLAARHGHRPILEYLAEKAPDKFQAMIEANDYVVFERVARYGHRPILEYLAEKVSDKFQTIIEAENYAIFYTAADNGHLHILAYLIEQSPHALEAMPGPLSSGIFDVAARKGDVPFLNTLLSYPRIFAHAEGHVHEYGNIVKPYIDTRLSDLRAQKEAAERLNPNVVFDVQEREATLLFYMVRHLIRLNDVSLHDDLLFLLRLPAVKALAHTAVTPSETNELLRLALSLGNRMASQCLLTIPAVRALAEQNNYYRDEARDGLDLRTLAQDRESSMAALTEGEKKRLAGVTERYQPIVDGAGVAHLMEDIRATLVARYEAHPAAIKIFRDGQEETKALPLSWEAFQSMPLSAAERREGLKAYCQHPDHTAWRYLSKPNRWMHEQASYVYVNPENVGEKWSTYEEYQPVIVLLYLAAIDKEAAPTDGYTLETRLEQYIAELALTGRAHNWDKKREKRDASGEVILDASRHPILEEYDDLEGDRPSCYSGVLRRLFQAVKGHPLLKLLTKDILDDEIRSFVYEIFKAKLCGLDETARSLVKSAWDKLVALDDLTEEEKAILKQLNISEQEQAGFMETLKIKWGSQFLDDAGFIKSIHQAFHLEEDEYHIGTLDTLNLNNLFNPATAQAPIGESRDSFFAAPRASEAPENAIPSTEATPRNAG